MVYIHSRMYLYHRLHMGTTSHMKEIHWDAWCNMVLRCAVTRSPGVWLRCDAGKCCNMLYLLLAHLHATRAVIKVHKTTAHSYGELTPCSQYSIISYNVHDKPVRSHYVLPVSDEERVLGKWSQHVKVPRLLRADPGLCLCFWALPFNCLEDFPPAPFERHTVWLCDMASSKEVKCSCLTLVPREIVLF